MIDQKRENLLNLALAATEVERRRVPELSAGYNSYSKTWEVIVQYQGDLAFLEEQGVRVTLLLFSYAILLVPESLMDYVTGLPQITYLEKAETLLLFRRCICAEHILYYTCAGGGYRVCLGMGCCLHALIQAWTMRIRISAHRTGQAGLHFYGIRRFREILRWGMLSGRCIHGGRSMRHLHLLRRTERFALVPSRDVTGHGTAVLGIAAGNGRSSADASHAGRGTGSNTRGRKAWKS